MFFKPRHAILRLTICLAATAVFMVPAGFAADNGAKAGVARQPLLTESTITIGYGRARISEGNYEPILLAWHLGADLKRFFPALKDYRGVLSAYMEPKIDPVFNPRTDVEFGIGLGLKYRHPLTDVLSAYAMVAVGPHFMTLQTEDQASGFIFFDSLSAGMSYFLTEKTTVNLEYRFRHMSNATIKMPNKGIDVQMVAVGYSIFF